MLRQPAPGQRQEQQLDLGKQQEPPEETP